MEEINIVREIITKNIGEKAVYTVEDVQKLFNKSRPEVYNLIYEGILIPIECSNGNKPRKYTFTLLSLINAYIKLTERSWKWQEKSRKINLMTT